jgi:autophagy-related protein 9
MSSTSSEENEPPFDILRDNSIDTRVLNDSFFKRVYNYYIQGGIVQVVCKTFINLFSIGFIVSFSSFLALCIDYPEIHNKKTLYQVIIPNCYSNSPFYIRLFLYPVCIWVFVQFLSNIFEISLYLEIKDFYNNKLNLSDENIREIEWNEITTRIEDINRSFTPVIITNKIMKYDNYMISIVNNKVLQLKRFKLTKILQFNLYYAIFKDLFSDSMQNEDNIRNKCFIIGMANLILLPFSIIILSLYLFFRYAEEYRKNPSSIGTRVYSEEALLKFREYNELDHFFKTRLNTNHPIAVRYTEQYPNKILITIANFILLISGSLTFVLACLAFIDQELLITFEITPGIGTLFYIGVFGSIFAIMRGLIPDDTKIYDPIPLIEELKSNLHFHPENNGNVKIKNEFCNLFIMQITYFFREFYSLMVMPYILWFVIPKQIYNLREFVDNNSIDVPNVGRVCSYAMFKDHFDNKMQSSIIQFRENNPYWSGSF